MNPLQIPKNLIPQFQQFGKELPPLQGETVEFAPQAWFLGPKAENSDLFMKLVTMAFESHISSRKNFHTEDSPVFTAEFKKTPEYINATNDMIAKATTLFNFLKKSLPYSSFRYVGHMTSDVTIASVIGYISTILYNSNNVTVQASPVTTFIEMCVGNDLCRMVGYPFPAPIDPKLSEKEKAKIMANTITPWGHITCGGTVANDEAFWSLYWGKFIPLALQEAFLHEAVLAPAANIQVELANGTSKKLSLCTPWEATNLSVDTQVSLPYNVGVLCDIDPTQVTYLLKKYHISNIGSYTFLKKYGLNCPVFMTPGTSHYSIPKAAAILGLGSDAVKIIPVDKHARCDLTVMRAHLQACVDHQIPVVACVSVMGTTEETAVDYLDQLIALRDEMRIKGLNFGIHVDAAWGGYFLSCIRPDYKLEQPTNDILTPSLMSYPPTAYNDMDSSDPAAYCSDHFAKQLAACAHCDTITIDPHKAGYIPYPAGSVCYRNSKLRDILVYTATYIGGTTVPTVGIYGIEGSKPGAAASAVYLSHAILRTSKSGYGKILKRCLLNTKLFYLRLLWLAQPSDHFVVTGIPVPPSDAVLADLKKKLIINGKWLTSDQIANDTELVRQLAQIGPDQNIVCYAFNIKLPNGQINTDYKLFCDFGEKVYERFDYIPEKGMKEFDLVVSNTEFGSAYGTRFLATIVKRLGLKNVPVSPSIPVLRSTIMDVFANETSTGSSFDVIFPIFTKEVNKIALAMTPKQAA
ncbi:pyridoxal phosphate-dependent decarboxylase family protein [Heterostelium album PN500]|uniref:Pyridoxal phosphate-dependent decarboxylase family protein n=1 Tax=Heterostelium pallidum (strain ATCC 26659 / Pp 5 / PN500) TaxID=670386 RepID=D3AZP6_HETP5|nr:pyridoxal phosphate-dependent decarboxylase family protein [Heterostelium album PN500]EFA85425.1 pyridoxal phosphate-dependent decarboxylase family protein [Heterostelium album PN500]|eukprot:XP_020437534.1 pyridoxal phosphate-dependent decarboxylase family protein [Heterostelium album PN500]